MKHFEPFVHRLVGLFGELALHIHEVRSVKTLQRILNDVDVLSKQIHLVGMRLLLRDLPKMSPADLFIHIN